MRYTLLAINNANYTPWKRGMRIIINKNNGHYIATVMRVRGKSLSLLFDDNKKLEIEADDPSIVGQGVKRKYKGKIPNNKLKFFLTSYQDTRVNNTPELASYLSNPLNFAKVLWKYYNARFFGSSLKIPSFKWMTGTKGIKGNVLGFYSYDLNDDSKDHYNISNKIMNISKKLVNSEEVFRTTILHMMCHQAVSELNKEIEHYTSSWDKWARRCGISGNNSTDIPVLVTDKTESKKVLKPVIGMICKSVRNKKSIYGVVLKIQNNKVILFTSNTLKNNKVSFVDKDSLYTLSNNEKQEKLRFTLGQMRKYISNRI